MWHTHPGGDDQPSEPDEKRIDGLLARREEWRSRTQRALELILTPAPGDDWTIHPWVYHRTKERGIALPAGIPGLAEAAVMKGR